MPTVIVVDDEPIVRNLVRLALSKEGYAVLDANSALEAATLCQLLDTVGAQQIDLLIVDHGLLPAKGRFVAEDIAKVCPAIKVLVISGRSYQTVEEEDGIFPGSSFLQKPFTPKQILTTVQNILFPSMQ